MIPVDDALRRDRLLARSALERAGTLAFAPVSSAKWTNVSVALNGAIRVQIEHADIPGVTPEMMRWWFENLAGSTTWDGVGFDGPEILNYHLWHHRDHIRITPLSDAPGGTVNRGFQVGALTRIDEQFNDYRDRIHNVMRTTRLDDRGFDFDIIGPARMRAGAIVHRYAPVPGGISFYAETTIDLRVPVLRPVLNRLVRPLVFSRATADHWIRHNIEETARSADVLPALYEHARSAG
ncbi:DAPG hydrolase family protein [Gordonia sp. VNK21]|uniref:DAPG hydrolase family protein n=1 Tax=Gordonia sp. VNK21 TaxID=3382483 RepID=UPI0038D45BAE